MRSIATRSGSLGTKPFPFRISVVNCSDELTRARFRIDVHSRIYNVLMFRNALHIKQKKKNRKRNEEKQKSKNIVHKFEMRSFGVYTTHSVVSE